MFTGKERDTETGLDYFGARYYGSTMGRWMSPDWSASPVPVPYADLGNPQSLNLYSYVDNNPLRGIDPDGHQKKKIQPPTKKDGTPEPPPAVDNKGNRILPNGRNGEPNEWVPDPKAKTRDGAPRYKPKYPVRKPADGGPPSPPNVSWDGDNGHWDVNNGDKTRDRYTPDGQLVDHDNNPITFAPRPPLPDELTPYWWVGTDYSPGDPRRAPLLFPGVALTAIPPGIPGSVPYPVVRFPIPAFAW